MIKNWQKTRRMHGDKKKFKGNCPMLDILLEGVISK